MRKVILAGLGLLLWIGPVGAQEVPEGQRWIQHLNGGMVLPFSRRATDGYDLGGGGEMGVGYRFTRQLSLTLNLGYYDLDQRFYGAASGEWIYVPLTAVVRYSWTLGDIRPFAALGVGVAFNNYSFSEGPGGGPPKASRAASDFMLAPGIGALYILGGDMAVFVQGRADFLFTPSPKPGQPQMDSPTIFLPILAGISFFPTK